jgi:tripartite-type tricarboxylate transporter receptor subunit TctC
MNRRSVFVILLASLLLPAMAQAQSYPRQTVRIVLGFGAGGGADVSARLFAAKMEGLTGQSFIVVNKPGASGNIAATEVVKAQPDGYTLLWSPSSAYSSNHLMYKNTPYDPKRDLRLVATYNRYGFVLLVNKDNPVTSVKELTEQLRKKGGGLYGSSATSFMACAELYKLATGLTTQQVNYKTTGDAVRDLIGAQVDYTFADAAFAIGQAQSGRVKMLAISLRGRLNTVPELPTMAESGLADYEMSGWIGLAAPRQTPEDIVARLNTLAQQVVAMPDVRKSILESSSEPMSLPLSEIEAFHDSQIEKWRKLLAESKFEMQ